MCVRGGELLRLPLALRPSSRATRDFGERRQTLAADAETLEARLDDALELAQAWN